MSNRLFRAFRRRALAALAVPLWLGGCSGITPTAPVAGSAPPHIDITLIGFNDLHGNLEPPHMAHRVQGPTGLVLAPAGGMAYFASAMAALKAQSPHHAVVSAGDMVGASPLVSSPQAKGSPACYGLRRFTI